MVRSASLAAAMLFIGLGASRAAGPDNNMALQQLLFGRLIGPGKTHACFQRVYDAAHLAQHPQQKLRAMNLLFTGERAFGIVPSYSLAMAATFRDVAAPFVSSGSCQWTPDAAAAGKSVGAIRCAVAYDGVGLDVAIKDSHAVVVSIPQTARLRGADSPLDEDYRFGADDKVFLLERTALKNCLALEGEGR